MNPWLRFLFGLALLAFATTAAAGEGRRQLDRFMNSVNSLQADFSQVVYGDNGDIRQEVQGRFLMLRPGRFRWDYTHPYQQLIVADGERLWIYDKDLDQVTVRRQKDAIGDTPALLLGGKADLSRSFTISEPASLGPDAADDDQALHWVQLTPHVEESGFQALRIGFRGGMLAAMELDDSFGQKTVLQFQKVRENITLDAAAFRFTPPSGVDLIDNTR